MSWAGSSDTPVLDILSETAQGGGGDEGGGKDEGVYHRDTTIAPML